MKDTDDLLSLINQAFSWRSKPAHVVPKGISISDIYEDALAFEGKEWASLSCNDLDKYHSAIFGFTPEAFCYFLPGVLSAGIKECRPDLIMNASLIGMLDRGNGPASWDSFFVERWGSMKDAEYESLQQWLLWLSEFAPCEFEDIQLTRSFDTLEMLANGRVATPIASFQSK